MKVKKGQPNYLYELKKYDMHTCIVEWAIVVLFILLGYNIHGSILNLIVAISVICIYFPVKRTQKYLKLHPFNPMSKDKQRRLEDINDHIQILYNPLLECKNEVIGIEAIAISGATVLVHISNPETNQKFTERFLTTILERRIENLNIKFIDDYKAFYDRAEGLHNMASISKSEITVEEKKIMGTIFRYYV